MIRILILLCLTALTLAAAPAGAAAPLSAPAHHSLDHQPAGAPAPIASHCTGCPDTPAGGPGGAGPAPLCCIGMACTGATGAGPVALRVLDRASALRFHRPLPRLHRARSPHPEPHPPRVPVTL